MTLVKIELEHQVKTFEGREIGRVSTRDFPEENSAFRARWVDMALYALDSGGYVLHRVGRSVVYHVKGGACGAGEPNTRTAGSVRVTVDGLPDDAEPCRICKPEDPEYLPEKVQVLLEQPRHTVDRCADVATVIRRITIARHRGSGITSTAVSRPVGDLIAQAMANDEGFASAPKPEEKIG
jgi:hypothetical protein